MFFFFKVKGVKIFWNVLKIFFWVIFILVMMIDIGNVKINRVFKLLLFDSYYLLLNIICFYIWL